jgi:hypothetical protein
VLAAYVYEALRERRQVEVERAVRGKCDDEHAVRGLLLHLLGLLTKDV